MKSRIFFPIFLLAFGMGIVMGAAAGPKGVIVVRPLAPGVNITIDGNFSDWPLDKFEKFSEQPLFPDGQNATKTDARGDYVVHDPDRCGFFNFARGNASEDDPNLDFETNTYFAYDSKFLYVLSIFIDDNIQAERDPSELGSQPYQNDGMEFFFDAKNDSNDCISDLAFPSIDAEVPNLDDLQVGTAINAFLTPVLADTDGGIGAMQGIIRSGNLDLLGAGDFSDGTFQEVLKSQTGPSIAAKLYSDLRAAKAPNPAIAQNPSLTFTGYAIELRIPFGIVDGFTSDHSMGFTVFWRDYDDDGSGALGQFIDWAQSTTAGGCVAVDAQITDIFYAPNWGALEFNKDKPLGGTSVQGWELQ